MARQCISPHPSTGKTDFKAVSPDGFSSVSEAGLNAHNVPLQILEHCRALIRMSVHRLTSHPLALCMRWHPRFLLQLSMVLPSWAALVHP